jgi:N-acetylmuramoyl-L-alanine amidase
MSILLRLIAAATFVLASGLIGVSVYGAHIQAREGSVSTLPDSTEQVTAPLDADVTPSSEAPDKDVSPLPDAPESALTATTVPAQEPMVQPVPDEAPPLARAHALDHEALSQPRAAPAPGAPQRHVIVLDPGHGRGDPGAVHYGPDGRVDLTEAAVNESVATFLRGFLEERGYDVYITRDGWGRAPSTLTQGVIWADLFSRVALAHAVDAEAFISIHANGSPRPEHRGVEMWYCGNHAYAGENAYLAQLMLEAALEGLDEYGYAAVNRGIQEDVEAHHSEGFGCLFLVTREARMPAILTELLFLTNDEDAAVLKDERAREAMARSMAEAIDTFFQRRDELFPEP